MPVDRTIAQEKAALVVIDLQYDFLPKTGPMKQDGALAVPNGHEVIRPIQSAIPEFDNVILTQDWHPAGHSSFASSHEGKAPFETVDMDYGSQVLWPDHCVQGSHGAALALDPWDINRAAMIVRKGMNKRVDSYSAFMENDGKTPTGLAGALRERGIEHLFLCGLATDFCVAFSALDARKMGFNVTLFEELCRGIAPESVTAQIAAMKDAGVIIA